MASEKNVNYSLEQVLELSKMYQEYNKSVAEIAEHFGKSEKSIRSKLVQLGIYMPASTNQAMKQPTKAELLRLIEKKLALEVNALQSLEKGDKRAINLLGEVIGKHIDLSV